MSIVTALCAIAGRGFDLTVSTTGLIGVNVGVTLLGIDFGVLAMLVGAATGSRGTALGITSALAAASYLISSLAPVGALAPSRPLRVAVLLRRRQRTTRPRHRRRVSRRPRRHGSRAARRRHHGL